MPRLLRQNFKGSTTFTNGVSYIAKNINIVLPTDQFSVFFRYKNNSGSGFISGEGFINGTGTISYTKQGTNDIQVYAYLNAPSDFATPRRLRFRSFKDKEKDSKWHSRLLNFYVVGGFAKCDEYVDGVKYGATHTVDYTGDTSSPPGSILIGSGGTGFNGNMCDYKEFSRALTPQEVSNLHFSGTITAPLLCDMPLNDTPPTYIERVSGNNGTGTNTAYSIETPSKLRVARRFMGGSTVFNGSAFINIQNTSGQLFNNTDFSISMWAKPSSLVGIQHLFAHQETATNNRVYVRMSNGVIGLLMSNSVAVNGPLLQSDKWFHIVGIFNRSTPSMSLYINGSLVATLNTGIGIPGSGLVDCQIGSRIAGAEAFIGKIADFRTFKKVLTDSEARSLYYTGISSIESAKYSLSDQPSTYIENISGLNGTGTATTYSQDTPLQLRKVVRDDKSLVTGASFTSVTDTSYDVSANGISLAFDFMCTAPTGATIIELQNAGITEQIRINVSTNGELFVWEVSGGVGNNASGSTPFYTIVPYKWYTVGFSYNKTTGLTKIYLNGKIIKSGITTKFPIGTDKLIVYTNANGSQRVKNLFVAMSELPQSDFVNHAFYGVAPSLSKNFYKIGEGAGNILYDSKDGNNLTLSSGTATWSPIVWNIKRRLYGGNLIKKNGDMSYIPKVNVLTTGNNRWIDGTTAGAPTGMASNVFGWYGSGSGATNAGAMFDTTHLSSKGNPMLKISVFGTSGYNQLFNNALTYYSPNGIRIKPSTSYTCSYEMETLYISGDSANGAILLLDAADAGGVGLGGYSMSYIKTTTPRTKYTFTFTTHSNAAYMTPEFRVYGHTGAANLIMDAWIGEIEIYENPKKLRQLHT